MSQDFRQVKPDDVNAELQLVLQEQLLVLLQTRQPGHCMRVGDLDTAVIVLRFRNGVIGTIDNCRQAAYGYDQRVEILGSKGSVATQNCYPNQAVISTGTEIRTDLPLNFFMERYTESFANEIRDFVEVVRLDRPAPVSGLDGRQAVAIGLAALKSYQERRPVRVSEVTA